MDLEGVSIGLERGPERSRRSACNALAGVKARHWRLHSLCLGWAYNVRLAAAWGPGSLLGGSLS